MIVHYLFLNLISILFFELFIRLNLKNYILLNLNIIKKSHFVIQSKLISDLWKGIALKYYSLRLIKFSLSSILILLVIFLFFLLTDFILKDFFKTVLTFYGILEVTIFIILYQNLRNLILK